MKRFVIASCCVSALAVSGCGPNPDALVKEQIQVLNEMATAITMHVVCRTVAANELLAIVTVSPCLSVAGRLRSHRLGFAR